jgi:hypothetical protein
MVKTPLVSNSILDPCDSSTFGLLGLLG